MKSKRYFGVLYPLTLLIVIFASTTNTVATPDAAPLPSFAPPVSYPLEYLAGGFSNLVVGDFNNDAKVDLIVHVHESGPIKLFLNNGSGGFGAPINIPAPVEYGNETMAVADFNLDGNLDLAFGYGCNVFIFYGDGAGNFGQVYSPNQCEGEGVSQELVVGDFNHDNKPDVFNKAFTNVVYLNDGLTLTAYVQESGSGWDSRLFGLAFADFNGDGNLDALGAEYRREDYVGGIMTGDGQGYFNPDFSNLALPPTRPPFRWQSVNSFTIGDFNSDGKPDVATPMVTVHLNDGTGALMPGVYYQNGIVENGDSAWDVKTTDMNGDGKLDLVTIGAGKISVLLGNGDGIFGSLTTVVGDGPFLGQRMAIADFNGDGKPDIAELAMDGGVVEAGNSNPRLTVHLNSTYQTPVGDNSSVVVNNTTFTFDNVASGGTTSVTPIDPASVGQVPGGFAVSNSVAYEIATTATFTGSVTLAFKVPGPISETDFNTLAILHNENGTLVNITAATPARDYANLTIYATTTSFSPFYLARQGSHVKSLFDQTKAYKSGSTIPVKLQVLNASNGNASSAGTALVARDLRRLSSNTTAPVVDSGNANPDYTFRYDATLGGAGGGYIYNLSTKGLASGQYVLSFYVGSERSFFYTVKFEVK